MLGAFGRVSLLPGSIRNLGLAVGARYVSAPTFSGPEGTDYEPSRLGFPDRRFFSGAGGGEQFASTFSPYVVATALLPGFAAGSAIHFSIGSGRLLSLMAEYNGFDANAGAQLDLGGIRIGGFSLGLAGDGASAYRSTKFGVAGSVVFCVAEIGPCRPRSRTAAQDTVVLPAPPPDTVVVQRTSAPELPAGAAETLCLAAGVAITVIATAAGDTLVGPSRVPLSDLRPGIVLAGTYAAGRDWFVQGTLVALGQRDYEKSGRPLRPRCADIVEVGSHGGVPLFADRSAAAPFEIVYVPVRPGLWQRYVLVPSETIRSGPEPGTAARSSFRINSGVRSSTVSTSDSTSK